MNLTLDMIGLVVRDIPASLRFYRLLGLAAKDPAAGEDYVECTLPNGLRVSWNTESLAKQVDPHWTTPQGGHRLGMAFKCESPAAVDAAYARVTEAGFGGHRAPFDAFWGQRYAQVQDPDGNVVDLFAPLK